MPLFASWRRRRGSHAPDTTTNRIDSPDADERPVVRQLCRTLDRAMELGLWAHADRVAVTAARFAARHASITERLARLNLARNRFDAAVDLIDACRTPTASLRLLRIVCLLQVGRKAEAHLDLHRWSARASAPLDARVLLALLEWESGHIDEARLALLTNLSHLEDPRTLETLVALSVHANRPHEARVAASRLEQAVNASRRPGISGAMLRSLGLKRYEETPDPQVTHVRELAMEILASEEVIGPLVEAQRRRPHLPTVRLLQRALGLVQGSVQDRNAALEALAHLAMLTDDREVARRWATEGLEHNPMNASLVVLLRELDASDESTTPAREAAA